MKTTESTSLRGDVLRYAKKQYHTEPEYLWLLDMSFAITSGHKNARRMGARNTN